MDRAKLFQGAKGPAPVVAIAIALAASAALLAHSQAAYDLEDQHYSQLQARDTGPRIKRECASSRGPAFAKCADEIIDATAQRERDQDNLSAQRKVANGATWFFGIGLVELALTLWGITLLRDQLTSTREALWKAGEANRISREQAENTRKANAAMVRPHVAIEEATIAFSDDHVPTIRLKTRNASNFTAEDWEWQPLLKYRAPSSADERKSPLYAWGPRGIRGINLAPDDHGLRIPVTLGFPFNDAEAVAITGLELSEGLRLSLTVFTRCFDALGNTVEDTHHFMTTAYNLLGVMPGFEYPFERAPPGTQIEGQEDKVPQ